jgi:ferrous iron transport protein A
MPELMTLDNLAVSRRGIVRRLQGDPSIRRRLLSMGFVPGVEVETLRVAPMGDPIAYELKGYNLSLRREEAAFVEVELIQEFALTEAPVGTALVVSHVHGGWGLRRRLRRTGIEPGVQLVKMDDNGAGPMAVRVADQTYRLGRGMASRVFVQADNGQS